MSQDIRDNDDFSTRRDSTKNESSLTRRDNADSKEATGDTRGTRLDTQANSGGGSGFYPPTTCDIDGIDDNSRPLPPTLERLYRKIESLSTKGAEADLYVVEERSSGNRYVLKHYRAGIIPKQEVTESIQKLSRVHPENFIQIIEYSYSSKLSYEILEYLEEGSLADLLDSDKILNKWQISDALEHLSTAVNILHESGIVHRDLKPGNVLVRQRSPIKLSLIDFGISSALNDFSVVVTSTSRTLAYAPPEAMSGKVSPAFDFWSLGMILVELLTGTHPFKGLSDFSINSHLIEKPVDVSHIQDERWRKLCQGLLLRDSKKRWGESEIKQWLAGESPTLEVDKTSLHTIRPYKFCKESYYTPQSLAVALAENWDDGVKRLIREDITPWIKDSLKDDDLFNDIKDIEEGITDDPDLKLLLAIAKLNPTLAPTYRQHSLTEEGLLAIVDSGDTDTIHWLHNFQVLSVYGEQTQKLRYLEIDKAWRESITQAQELLSKVQSSEEVTNDLGQWGQNTFSVRGNLLKYSVSERQKIELIKLVLQALSPEARECKWFNSMVPESLEDAPTSRLYILFLTAPIAKHITEKAHKQHVDTSLKIVTPIREVLDSIESGNKEVYEKFFSDTYLEKLTTISAIKSKQSLIERKEQLAAVVKEIPLVCENINSYLRKKEEELVSKIREFDITISSRDSKIRERRQEIVRKNQEMSSRQAKLKELREELAQTGYYKQKRDPQLQKSFSSQTFSKEISILVFVLLMPAMGISLLVLLTLQTSALFIFLVLLVVAVLFFLWCSTQLSLKPSRIESLRHEIEALSSIVPPSTGKSDSLQKDIDSLESELVDMRRNRSACKKELNDLARVSNSVQALIGSIPNSLRDEMLPGDIKLELVFIHGNRFKMGSPLGQRCKNEQPPHDVMVQSLEMSQYPITQAQWQAVAALPQIVRSLSANCSYHRGDNLPVDNVSWDEAIEFCKRLSAHAGKTYTLPSEAQWEYACRAGTQTFYSSGDDIEANCKHKGPEQTSPVNSYPKNSFGLYDMHGNIWEWCLDHWHDNYTGAPIDGSAWLTSQERSARLLRGGAYHVVPENCRSAYRFSSKPDSRASYIGFRIVCPIEERSAVRVT